MEIPRVSLLGYSEQQSCQRFIKGYRVLLEVHKIIIVKCDKEIINLVLYS